MNKLALVLMTLFAVTSAEAAQKIYVDKLECTGPVVNKPSSMHPSYSTIFIEVQSFRSMRRDGTLADSTDWAFGYGKKEDVGGERWYNGNLMRSGNKVFRTDEGLALTIDESYQDKQYGFIRLTGTYGRQGTVVGDYYYKLKCTARVVKKPSRIDDYTAN